MRELAPAARGGQDAEHATLPPDIMGITVEVARFLKIRNRESRFLLPDREMRNWESENDSFSIPFMIPLLPIPSKCAKNGQGIGIAIL